MFHDLLRRIFHSVYTQLLLICIAAGIVIVFLAGGFLRYGFQKSAQPHIQKNVVQYLNYVIKDLGSPPSMERAKAIAVESGMQIRFESPAGGWSTSLRVPSAQDIEEDRRRRALFSKRIWRDKHPFLIRQENGTFVFLLRPEQTGAGNWELWAGLLALLITAVLAVTYRAVRRIMSPLTFLAEGVRQVSGGNLEYHMPGWRSEEFGQLSAGFNTMTGRIRTMLHAKEQLLLDVSHELRSPLTRMKVALEMLDESAVQLSLADDIREMETMVTEILEAARLRTTADNLKIEPIPVEELFHELDERFTNHPPGLVIDTLPEHAAIQGDRMLVTMVLDNIITNAIKYSPQNGTAVRLSFFRRDEACVIAIKDRGPGIPEEELPYIFEPFYRVDKSRSKRTGGYGLGLSLCKTIMDAHQGRIAVESASGEGTTVSLYFNDMNPNQ